MDLGHLHSGLSAGEGTCPDRGQRLHDFRLPKLSGREVQLSDLWGHRNLVLVFAADLPVSLIGLLSEIAHQYSEFAEEQAQVLVVVAGTKAQAEEKLGTRDLPFSILLDVDGKVHRSACAIEPGGRPGPAIYVTDQYGEIFEVYRAFDGRSGPKVGELLEWLQFINMQCPECFPPEWPAA